MRLVGPNLYLLRKISAPIYNYTEPLCSLPPRNHTRCVHIYTEVHQIEQSTCAAAFLNEENISKTIEENAFFHESVLCQTVSKMSRLRGDNFFLK
jgi:hypothetical protein